MLEATSGILYVRASLRPFKSQLISEGGVLPFLKKRVDFSEVFVPHFYKARPFWRRKNDFFPKMTNSGMLGAKIAQERGAIVSKHPSHSFVGLGEKVSESLSLHNGNQACFFPISDIAEKHDFSMLLVGCVDDSPGFSTVHATQYSLGLTKKHLARFLFRWDNEMPAGFVSQIAKELPGCSSSFGEFYSHYKANKNFVEGTWDRVKWIFIPSALRALATEMELLKKNPRFVECGRLTCISCRLRYY